MQSTETTNEVFAFDAKAVFTRILVPIDFSEGSRRALATALELKKRFGSTVHLFRLTESGENDQFLAGTGAAPVTPQEIVLGAEGRLRRFVDNLFPGRSGEVEVDARIGVDVLHGIARSATQIGATLVLLAEEPRLTVFRTEIEKIVRELDMAVMILRTPPSASLS